MKKMTHNIGEKIINKAKWFLMERNMVFILLAWDINHFLNDAEFMGDVSTVDFWAIGMLVHSRISWAQHDTGEVLLTKLCL